MITKEQYESFLPFRDVVMLFGKTGEYVGGCDKLFESLNPSERNCSGCKAARLLEVYNSIKQYELNK